MKRNWDLIRKILIEVEELGNTQSVVEHVDGTDSEAVSYHIHLMIDSGLVEGQCSQGMDGPLRCFASALTWEGHEFLDKIRSATMWNKIKSVVREKSLPMTFDVIKAAAAYAVTAIFKN